MKSIAGDFSSEIVRINDDFTFLDEIKRVNTDIAAQFEQRVTELRKYAAILENHFDLVDESRRPAIFSQLAYGYRRSSEAVSWALILKKNSVKRVKQAEAIAAHDNFYDFAERQKEQKGRTVKDTGDNKKWYTQMDPDVIKAKEEEAISDAILEQFSSLKFEFIQGTSSIKAMYYGNKDSSSLNSAAINTEIE